MIVEFGKLKVGTCFKNDIGYCVKVNDGTITNSAYWLKGRGFVHIFNSEKVLLLPFRFKV